MDFHRQVIVHACNTKIRPPGIVRSSGGRFALWGTIRQRISNSNSPS